MGDAGGNLEEHIGSVEDEIERVRDEIRRVKVKIDNCTDLQNIREFLVKESELRDKESELRDKESELRDTKSQLRDLGTEYDWLVQKVVPPAPSSRAGIYPSSSSRKRIWLPVKVEHWDVMNDIEEYLGSADRRKRVHQIAVTAYT